MNAKRRRSIRAVINILNGCLTDLEYIKDEEDDSRSNIPENLETSEFYEHSENCSEALSDTLQFLEDAISELYKTI